MTWCAIILCGGRSSRMGVDKALLPFGGTPMVERMISIAGRVVGTANIVVAAGMNQQLPDLAAAVVRDDSPYQGPLTALLSAAEALPPETSAVFVTGCDMPLLSPAVISYLFEHLGDYDCVVPQGQEHLHPLCAVYRRSALHTLKHWRGHSLQKFVAALNTRLVGFDDLRLIDPELRSLHNINTHEDYILALKAAGLPTP